MLATSASRRVQSSHATITGIKNPWLYSSWVLQRCTNSKSASLNATSATSYRDEGKQGRYRLRLCRADLA